jgi:hypothetical protein
LARHQAVRRGVRILLALVAPRAGIGMAHASPLRRRHARDLPTLDIGGVGRMSGEAFNTALPRA